MPRIATIDLPNVANARWSVAAIVDGRVLAVVPFVAPYDTAQDAYRAAYEAALADLRAFPQVAAAEAAGVAVNDEALRLVALGDFDAADDLEAAHPALAIRTGMVTSGGGEFVYDFSKAERKRATPRIPDWY